MNIEVISPENLLALTQLALQLWPECDFAEELAGWKSVQEDPDQTCFLAKYAHEYIGFIHVTLRHDYVEGADSTPVAYIEGLFVDEKYRKTGIGKQLLQQAEAWAKSHGVLQIASDTEIANQASIDFHQKVGFTEANRIVCFMKNLSN
jgi:aminoglycoside 6'-N-acetyltransferase I